MRIHCEAENYYGLPYQASLCPCSFREAAIINQINIKNPAIISINGMIAIFFLREEVQELC
jgi:hypothetical protein